jgi:hypothetical protein
MNLPAVARFLLPSLFGAVPWSGCAPQAREPAFTQPRPNPPPPPEALTSPSHRPPPTPPGRPAPEQECSYVGWRTANAAWLEPSQLFDELAQAHLICLTVDKEDPWSAGVVSLAIAELVARGDMSGHQLALALDRFESRPSPLSHGGEDSVSAEALLRHLAHASSHREIELPFYRQILTEATTQQVPIFGVGRARRGTGPGEGTPVEEEAAQGERTEQGVHPSAFSPSPEDVTTLLSTRTPARQLLLVTSSDDCLRDRLPAWISYATPLRTLSLAIDRTGSVDTAVPLPPSRINGEVDYQIVIQSSPHP